MVFLKNALMCTKKSQIINHDCLPILMLLHIMLYVMLAYLMLFAALSNAVCFIIYLLLLCHAFLNLHLYNKVIENVYVYKILTS